MNEDNDFSAEAIKNRNIQQIAMTLITIYENGADLIGRKAMIEITNELHNTAKRLYAEEAKLEKKTKSGIHLL